MTLLATILLWNWTNWYPSACIIRMAPNTLRKNNPANFFTPLFLMANCQLSFVNAIGLRIVGTYPPSLTMVMAALINPMEYGRKKPENAWILADLSSRQRGHFSSSRAMTGVIKRKWYTKLPMHGINVEDKLDEICASFLRPSACRKCLSITKPEIDAKAPTTAPPYRRKKTSLLGLCELIA